MFYFVSRAVFNIFYVYKIDKPPTHKIYTTNFLPDWPKTSQREPENSESIIILDGNNIIHYFLY